MMIGHNYYDGLCVGGPYDGQFVAQEKPWFECVERPEFKFGHVGLKEIVPTTASYKKYRYDHVVGLRGSYEIDFWVNFYDFPEVADIFQHVFSNYAKIKATENNV